jgi:hypothetical protein
MTPAEFAAWLLLPSEAGTQPGWAHSGRRGQWELYDGRGQRVRGTFVTDEALHRHGAAYFRAHGFWLPPAADVAWR